MKSHFQFSSQQRSGIFLLIIIIIVVQCLYWFFPNIFTSLKYKDVENNEQLKTFREELDSLSLVEIENNTPKIYPFNPNYITDFKGYTLGMTTEEIDRLHKFRETDQWINSAEEFQQVTKVSDSFLKTISPYFKFPEWVTNPKPKSQKASYSYSTSNELKTFEQKVDLNSATANQLKKIYGVGDKLSERIINYRNKHPGGFISDVELSEVWGLEPDVIERIKNEFTVKTPRTIDKIPLNTASRDELVTIKYIDYEIAHHIIEERTLRGGFKSLEELAKVEDFPIQKIEIIKLYLQL